MPKHHPATCSHPQRAFLLAALAILFTLLLSSAAAAEAPAAPPARALIVLSTATTPASHAIENQYVAELRLALEGVEVRGVAPGTPGFEARPLSEQIELVRALLERDRGLAATWLNPVSSELVLVHMVVLTSGRVLVRMIEGNPTRPGFATDLAMASRELLGTAYLFTPPPPEAPLVQVVETVRDLAASDGPARSAIRDWSLVVRARAGGGLAGFDGPSILVGGELGVERRVIEGLSARLFVDARGGPLDSGSPLHPVQTVFVSPGLGASYLWGFGPLRLGPALDLRATWTTLQVQSTPTATQTFSLWSFRADVGPELRVALGDRVELLASGALAVTPLRKLLTLESTGETLIATPFLGWDSSLGVAVQLF
jgi:hypothetical protein